MFCFVFLALVGAAAGANVLCMDYSKDGGGEVDGYYIRPIPENCGAQTLGNWKPTFRITEPHGQCPGGYKEYKDHCYKCNRPQGHKNFRDGEQLCNREKGHIFTANDREEYTWVEQNVMTSNEWYFTGTFCSIPQSQDPKDFFTPSGEDMREIAQKLQTKMHPGHNVNEKSHPCALTHRNNNDWRWKWHHSQCQEGRAIVCEAPLG